tara:strand:+ start:876 stop:1454 length:579 start_codon:yes stop_codon:yes gene_type:complete
MSVNSFSHNQNLLRELATQSLHHQDNKAHLATIVSNTANGIVSNTGIFPVQADCSGTITANLSVADNLLLTDIQTAVQIVDDAYGDMTVNTLMNSTVVAMASTLESDVLTKPAWVKDIGVVVSSSVNGLYNVSLMVSNDNVTYVNGFDFNYDGVQTLAYSINSQTGIGFKYYKFSVTNNDMASQNFTIQASY